MKEKVTTIEKLNIKRFNTSVSTGLTDDLVKQRIEENLVNKGEVAHSKSYFSIFKGNVLTFFNLLGLIVTISLIYIGAPISRFFFVLIYIANMFIGIVQELRAKHCVDKLCLLSSNNVIVIRNGKEVKISQNEVVLDDIISLSIGSQIPTDSIIIDGYVEVNESMLTGESIPVKKNVGDIVFAGSFVTTGNCKVRAEKVGAENYISKLSIKAKKYKRPKSELMNSLSIIIKTITIIIFPIAIAHIVKSGVLKSSLSDNISGVSTLIIGMIPSGMFLLTSLALATGIIKMARNKTLIQDLYSLEMLARVDTICFDKTGTLTDGNMTVRRVALLDDVITTKEVNNIMCSALSSLQDKNHTSLALIKHFVKDKNVDENLIVTKYLPFNSTRKLSAVTFNNNVTYAFGAPEYVLNKEDYELIKDKMERNTRLGFRVILLAQSEKLIVDDKLPKDFIPIAMIVLEDNIRKESVDTVKWFNRNDVNIKVISGDNPITVSEVAKRVGIIGAEKYISLDGLTDSEVIDCADDYTIFGRVTPEQKALLVKALKDKKHTVAMTGDGVNDILAMKEADCAITVSTGSEATRNISHIVLLDDNFASMPKVVYEGRRVVNNVERSSSLYLMKTLFTMIFAILTLCLPYMNSYPFQLSHMIILEIFVIGFPSFFLSFQPNSSRIKGKFILNVLAKTLPSALLMIVNVMLIEIFKISFKMFDDSVYTTMEVIVFTYAGIVSLFSICSPINNYRGILCVSTFVIVTVISVYAIINGSNTFELVSMMPFRDYWHHLLLVVAIILEDIPIDYLIHFLCRKIKFKHLKKLDL